MVKETPSLGRIAAMVAFTLSCFGILLFLWLAFGGSVPLKPQSYRFKVDFPEAATLAQEADVRLAGVNIGKVKQKSLDKGGARTKVVIEIDSKYAPIPKDTRAILRQKTLLGETYVELSPGDPSRGTLPDGATLPNQRVAGTVQLDEIFNAFDRPTRQAFRDWVRELSGAIRGGRSQDLNNALGNLAPFAVDGATLLKTLDDQSVATRRLVRNTGVVFGAINARSGALRRLIVSGNAAFGAIASRDRALAQTIRVFPTFLNESRVTLARLERFAVATRPLVNQLKPAADDLGPTVRDLGGLAPDLQGLFGDLLPLTAAGRKGLPDLQRFLAGSEPVFESARLFLPELNPILSMFNYYQSTIAGFITNGNADLAGTFGGKRYQTQIGIIDPTKIIATYNSEQPFTRGNSYIQPNALTRGISLGTFESFRCPGGKEQNQADDAKKLPPCFVAPPSLLSGKQFDLLGKGQAPVRSAPGPLEGNKSADPARR